MKNNFDIIIPIAKSDLFKFKNNILHIQQGISGSKIFIIANREIEDEIRKFGNLEFISEDKILNNMSFHRIRSVISDIYPKAVPRTGWYFQQFIKLAYAYISQSEYYLSWDIDTIPLNKPSFFDNHGKPYFAFIKAIHKHYDINYFKLIKKLWPMINSSFDNKESYIAEHMLFNTCLVKEMLSKLEENPNMKGVNFYEKILYAIPRKTLNLSGFSEFETYVAYVNSVYPDWYVRRHWKNLRHGKVFFGDNPTSLQLKWVSSYFNAVSFENFDHHWNLCRYLCSTKKMQKKEFIDIYKVISPLIFCEYEIRLAIRNIIRA